MGIGFSILLLALGAILAFAVQATTVMGVSVQVVGYILMAAGAIGLIWSLIIMSMRRRPSVVDVTDDDPVVVRRTADDTYRRPGGP
ncbi:MAG TPA: DUF6458 family protein [Candidatus Nanopelagicales bacterium]|nr:DUF6458 family protein [Candidatus Nanopelagicales bacterium]